MPCDRHRKIVRQAKATIFLDATLTLNELALKLGCHPEEIFCCKQKEKLIQNLKIIQIKDLGKASMSRRKNQERRIEALISHFKGKDPNTKVMDFIKFSADGAWYRDSRGVNMFLDVLTLLLVGTPIRNIESLKAEWTCLVGKYPSSDDQEFRDWVDLKIRADIIQGIGRLRANRRPDEQLCAILITNFDLGIEVEEVNAKDITPDAMDRRDSTESRIIEAATKLKGEDKKITLEAIGALAGVSKGYISREFGELYKQLKINEQGTLLMFTNATDTYNSKSKLFDNKDIAS